MSRYRYNTDIGQRNTIARERGSAAAREFARVVETFNKVLQFKEKIGESLEADLAECGRQVKSNTENLETLTRNIEIYNQNLDKIHENLEQLSNDEKRIKQDYESLLHGMSDQPDLEESKKKEENETAQGSLSHESLRERRQNFLKKLDEDFNRMDQELANIEKMSRELVQARGEISTKKAEALTRKATLEETSGKLRADVSRIELELQNSLKEEEILLDEFFSLIENVENCLELKEETDQVLFTSLTASDTKP
jgi:chromosome segregation ATPase